MVKLMKRKFDYLVVGAGLFGSVFTQQAISAGKSVLVIDKRGHVGGNIYTETVCDIEVHKYGPHIFHTNNKDVWEYIQQFAEFNRFTNSPLAYYRGELYSLPFNMYTFNKMWGVITPDQAVKKIDEQRAEIKTIPKNLEEQAISLVGRDIYEKLIKGYTEKQWGRDCKDLPASIIKRLPVRYTYDNNYYNAAYQGIPTSGYTSIINKLLRGAEIQLNTDYLKNEYLKSAAETTIYTGAIDAYYDYIFGPLEYRSLRFENEILHESNYQGNAVINYTDSNIPWTRIIEHKWFNPINTCYSVFNTVISKEYSEEWDVSKDAYYPINTLINEERYKQYKKLADAETNVFFGGRLGEYKYYDMDRCVESALHLAKTIIN